MVHLLFQNLPDGATPTADIKLGHISNVSTVMFYYNSYVQTAFELS